MPSKRFDIHPDLVAGQPIPEIEPRIDTLRLEIVARFNRWWFKCMGIVVLLAICLAMFGASLLIRVVCFTLLLVVWMLPYFRKDTRGMLARQRELNRMAFGSGGNQQHDHWCIPLRDNAMHFVLTMGLVISAPMLMMAGESTAALMINLGMYMLMGGLGMIVVGRVARQPGPISCGACSYPLTGLTIPCFCPECGRSIIDPELTTDRPRVRSPWFVRIGLATVLLASVMLYVSVSKPRVVYATMPAGVLLRLSPTDDDAFDRYTAAHTTLADTDRMVDRLIEARIFDEDSYQSYAQQRWLGGLLMSGGLSTDQLDRLFEPYLDLRINTSEPIVAGDPVTVWISNQRPFSGINRVDPELFFGGFVIGDDPTPYARSEDPIGLEDIARIDDGVPGTRRPISRGPEWTFVPEHPGEIEISAHVVVGIFPSRVLVTIDWEGDERLDTQTLWWTSIELTRAIRVTE